MYIYIKLHVAYRVCTIKLKLPMNQKPLIHETKVQLLALLPTEPPTPLIHASSLGTVLVSIKLCMTLLRYVPFLFWTAQTWNPGKCSLDPYICCYQCCRPTMREEVYRSTMTVIKDMAVTRGKPRTTANN